MEVQAHYGSLGKILEFNSKRRNVSLITKQFSPKYQLESYMRQFYFWYSKLNSKPILIPKILDSRKIAQPDFKYEFNIRIPYIRIKPGRLKMVESINSNFKHQKDLNYTIRYLSYLDPWSFYLSLLAPPKVQFFRFVIIRYIKWQQIHVSIINKQQVIIKSNESCL